MSINVQCAPKRLKYLQFLFHYFKKAVVHEATKSYTWLSNWTTSNAIQYREFEKLLTKERKAWLRTRLNEKGRTPWFWGRRAGWEIPQDCCFWHPCLPSACSGGSFKPSQIQPSFLFINKENIQRSIFPSTSRSPGESSSPVADVWMAVLFLDFPNFLFLGGVRSFWKNWNICDIQHCINLTCTC